MKIIRNRVTTTFLCVFISIILSTFTVNAKCKLSASEINQLFVGKVWVGPKGEFLFTKNGKYSYFHCVASNNYPYGLRGTWDYKMTSKGKIVGKQQITYFIKLKKGTNIIIQELGIWIQQHQQAEQRSIVQASKYCFLYVLHQQFGHRQNDFTYRERLRRR